MLEYGFAYGEGGDKLKGKKFLMVISTFGPEEACQHDGYNHFTMEKLLRPFEQTANLCKLEYVKPLIINGVAHKSNEDITASMNFVKNEIRSL
jgi:glutathione-regulated potassium-efflux system ancillary protein KefG